ncbi:class I SAM-dependent methyltransferase [Streptomyces antimicrobicus]|uniref:Class I SAM-dependent methyltransferase n=1 Tax=Streptomyces antimicrobicus TaxID=2883108 RepID=A0ABS8B347_9ACTN|nr:class I SAM-dependent methyltransferase [Streptomyces antimicrobicus]MCB5179012.1 class I SAM-dependent methyltransferase [Streptomyces antimicrobicus]
MPRRPATTRPFNSHMHQVLDAVTALPAGASVLDAGCGGGAVARWLAEEGGYDVLGIDLELPADAATHGRLALPGGGGLQLDTGDLLHLAAEPGRRRYDAVLLFGVLHYGGSADAVRRMLRAADRLAAPSAPIGLSWICDEVPLTYEEAYLPGRHLVGAALTALGRTRAHSSDRDITHTHGGSPVHDHRIVYEIWRRP